MAEPLPARYDSSRDSGEGLPLIRSLLPLPRMDVLILVTSMSEKTQQRRASDEQVLHTDRRATVDRRNTNDRRKKQIPVAFERRTGGERRNVERRRQVDPTTCERDYSLEEVEFMSNMDLYKRLAGRQFPTWTEVLEVLHAMGYRKVAEASPLPGQPGHISRRQQGQATVT